MFATLIVFIIFGFITGAFIVMELNWSIKNVQINTKNGKITGYLTIPLCFMPVIWDVLITIGISILLGTKGMMGMAVSMVACSMIAGYLFYARRKHHWRYA